MATFPSITPKYGQRKKSSPNIRTVRFADGYEHRIMLGLAEHQNAKEFNFTFEVSEGEADTIEAFLDARALDRESFTFAPPGESSSSQFVCEDWSKSIPYLNRATIQATFIQVFEPVS